MSLIHRGGRVNPSPVQPDSYSSVFAPSFPPPLPPPFLSLFSLGSISPSLFSHMTFWAGSLVAKVKQVRGSDQIRKTSAIKQRFDTKRRPLIQSSPSPKSNQDACPISGQRYVRAAPSCFFVHRFLSLFRDLTARSLSHLLLLLLPLCIVISHALKAALAGARWHFPSWRQWPSVQSRETQSQVTDDHRGARVGGSKCVRRIKRLPGRQTGPGRPECLGRCCVGRLEGWVATRTCPGPRKQFPMSPLFTLDNQTNQHSPVSSLLIECSSSS